MAASGELVQCPGPGCRAPLPIEVLTARRGAPCPACGRFVQVTLFPALFRGIGEGRTGEELVSEDEAGCFYHPAKRAVVACEACGRFLCSLCDVEFGVNHLCPACIQSGQRKGHMNLLRRRVLWDDVALALAVLPALFFWPSILTAPVALFIAIKYWRAPTSIVGRSKVRFMLAIAIAFAEMAGWLTFAVFLLRSIAEGFR